MPSPEILYFLDHPIEVERKARFNRLTLRMHPDKFMRVKTNMRTKPEEIISFLMSKKRWIEKNISKFRELNERFKIPQIAAGEYFPFLGELKYLQFAETKLKKPFFKIEDGFLVCYLPRNTHIADSAKAGLSEKLKKFYKKQAELYLTERMQLWSQVTNLKPQKLIFRSNQTRWGSCSSQKHISLNWKLICQSQSLIDYVIVHELCHLKHLNHSMEFWSLVESFLPTYQTIEKVLDDQQMLGRFLD